MLIRKSNTVKYGDIFKRIACLNPIDNNSKKHENISNITISFVESVSPDNFTSTNGKNNIDKFLKDLSVDINNDYWKGYLLHLLADDFTYNHILKQEFNKVREDNAHDIVYEEFYYLNKTLILHFL